MSISVACFPSATYADFREHSLLISPEMYPIVSLRFERDVRQGRPRGSNEGRGADRSLTGVNARCGEDN